MAKAGTIPGFVDILRNYAPTWLVQLPGLASAEDRELLKQETLGATRDRMLREMWRLIAPDGLFFARLASNIGLEGRIGSEAVKISLNLEGYKR